MMFRDWPRTLQPASYRGVRFFVERDTVETGRRLVVHEFPLKDVPYIEDLGRDANKMSVSAYVVSDNADGEERALRSACERGGAGSLSLPMETFQAHCESCSRDFAKDKLGFIAFNLKFVREGTGSIALPGGFLAAQVGVAAQSLVAALSVRFLSGFAVNGRASFVGSAAVDQVRTIAATLDAIVRSSPMDPGLAPSIMQSIDALDADAESLVAVGLVPERITRTSVTATPLGAASTVVVDRIAGVLESYRLAVTPETALSMLDPVLSFSVADTLPVPLTPSRRRIADNAAALDDVVRGAALATYASALAARIFKDRREAVQARADAGEMFAAELDRITSGSRHELFTSLVTLSGQVAEYLSRRIADMAPVLIVEGQRSMPSLWWSNRLYGGHAKAEELVRLNRVIHGGFMPVSFEALAR